MALRWPKHVSSREELANAAAALARMPRGYWRLKKRLGLFRQQAHIVALAPTPKTETMIATASELVELGAISAEAGYDTVAAYQLAIAMRRAPDLFDRMRFMGLTRAGSLFDPMIAKKYAADLDAFDFMQRHEGSFADVVRANAASICVVGNSPCELGKGFGPRIDDHALVIRFNNFEQSPEFQSDYGSKCDIWCRSPFYQDVIRRGGFKPQLTITALPLVWRKENGQDMAIEYMRRDEPLDSPSSHLCSTLAAQCGARPSSGLVVLAWIKDILGSLDDVSVFGFALSDQTEGIKQYFKGPPRKPQAPHNWISEREVFDRLVARAA